MAYKTNPRVLSMILAGGEGSRLQPLTKTRAKPAVPFAGRYRIIDFVLSNFINSRFYRIKVLTQYKSNSLNKHISRGWHLTHVGGNFIEPVPAQQRVGKDWYRGSADAIYQNIEIITDDNPEHVLIFGADHIYKMNVRQMLAEHIERKAECTIAAIPMPCDQAYKFGVLEIDEDWRLIGFQEKPKKPKTIPGRPDLCLISMGNYIFTVDTIIEEVQRDHGAESQHDFGRNIIPGMYKQRYVHVYDFSRNSVPGMSQNERGYWRDVGDIDTYWETHMDLISVSPRLDIHNVQWPIHTYYFPYPPAKFIFDDEQGKRLGVATNSLVSEGAIISGGHIDRSILSPMVRINSYSYVSESILFEDVNIGRHAMIKRAIIDKHVDVPPGAKIGYDLEEDKRRFHVTASGIVVVPKRHQFK
ncbi:MAG: glucose-1-phosphate adenylyltransferase [Candidatus Alcyoniella australis]|nr:glucose-1-phosphate adenylyltransferase [Candidatus Alcyoniella australis]